MFLWRKERREGKVVPDLVLILGERPGEIFSPQGFQIKVCAFRRIQRPKDSDLIGRARYSPDCICQTISTSRIYYTFSEKTITMIIFCFRKYISLWTAYLR